MRAVVQRVTRCRVSVSGSIVGEIAVGLLVYLGISTEDAESDVDLVTRKVTGLRVFEDEDGQMNLSSSDINAQMCVISQFTLYGDTRKGNRPSFSRAARPEQAVPLYERFISSLRDSGFVVASGVFGAHMEVDCINDGPVTILIDSRKTF